MSPHTQRTAEEFPMEPKEPRTLLELNALAAIGVILDKPAWWIQWVARATWLKEIEEVLVCRTLEQTMSHWPRSAKGVNARLRKFAEAAKMEATDVAKTLWIKELMAQVCFPVALEDDDEDFHEGLHDDVSCTSSEDDDGEDEDEEEDCEGEEDSGDELVLDDEGNEVKAVIAPYEVSCRPGCGGGWCGQDERHRGRR